MIKKYKIIAGGYRQGTYTDKESAMQEANRLSKHNTKVIVRLIKGNGQPFQCADDIVIMDGVVAWVPKMYICGVNIT